MKISSTLLPFALAACLVGADLGLCAWAAQGGKPSAEPAAAASKATPAVDGAVAVEESLASSELAAAVQSFKGNATDASWSDVFKSLKALLAKPQAGKSSPASLIKQNPVLNDLGVKVVAAASARIWTFPRIQQCQAVLVQWNDTKVTAVPGSRKGKTVSVVVSRVEPLTLPAGITLRDARILEIGNPAEKTKNKYLICVGGKQDGNALWLGSYRATADGWHESNEPLSGIPPFLMTNISGFIGFSGQDLVVTIAPTLSKAVAEQEPSKSTSRLPESPASSYKLVLRLVGGKFALEGSPIENTPYNAVYQFVHAISQGRTDLAKAWLVDSSLISIPKYIGLAAKPNETPARIINMSHANLSSYRYRLVTFERYDLIFDVTKSRQQWAIKAMFVAPADPLLQKVARSLPVPESKAPATGESGKPGEAVAKEDEKIPARKGKN